MSTYFSGLVARSSAGKAGVRETEEAFICSMFHKLGRLLTAFYFHEEFQEIQKRSKTGGVDEEQAASQVLGYHLRGARTGRGQGAGIFRARLTGTLRRVPEGGVRKPQYDERAAAAAVRARERRDRLHPRPRPGAADAPASASLPPSSAKGWAFRKTF